VLAMGRFAAGTPVAPAPGGGLVVVFQLFDGFVGNVLADFLGVSPPRQPTSPEHSTNPATATRPTRLRIPCGIVTPPPNAATSAGPTDGIHAASEACSLLGH
jgi:hypothetical protein